MKRTNDPRRLDVAALAAAGDRLAGEWPGDGFDRLAEAQSPPQDLGLAPVAWSAEGELRRLDGTAGQTWMHVAADTHVWLTCQRCLQPMKVALTVDRDLRFARDESEAEALDAEVEEDVLALSRSLDLHALVEDELLLALPLVPRHDVCPEPLPMSAGESALAESTQAANPFAALQGLKTGRTGSGE